MNYVDHYRNQLDDFRRQARRPEEMAFWAVVMAISRNEGIELDKAEDLARKELKGVYA